MSRRWRLSVWSVALVLALVITSAEAGGPPGGHPVANPASSHAPEEVLVRFRDNVTHSGAASAHAAFGAVVLKRFAAVDQLDLVKLPPGLSVKDAVTAYRRNPAVLYAEPNYEVTALGTPNDPSFGSLWGLHNTGQTGGTPDADVDAPEAWNLATGSRSVVVAVIDTGIDYNHEDLRANVWRNTDCDNDGVDDDLNGYVDDCYGIDTINGDSDPLDDYGHGTHVAGTIGAVGSNGIGVTGLNWAVSIVACKFLGADGSGYTDGAIECLDYVKRLKDRGVNIVATNNSWGGGGFSEALRDAIDAQRQAGVLFIAAAGNDTEDNDAALFYPASYYLPNVIAVAATTSTDALADFSNYGRRTVHVGAPGHEIWSTIPGNAYASHSGTSMATPHVTGLAALLKAQNSLRDWRALKNLMLSSGDPTAALGQTIAQRRLNASRALACSNAIVLSRLRPIVSTVPAAVGQPLALSALNINCGVPNGDVIVVVSPGGATVTLRDDGLGSDQAAGDGVYSGNFTPSAPGTQMLTFPNGDVVTVQVLDAYRYAPVAYGWRTLAGTSLDFGDDSAAPITPPFPVRFGAGTFGTLYVSSNGTISVSESFAGYGNEPIPTAQIETLIAPFWDDLYAVPQSAQNVFWAVTGSAPARELVLEWRDVRTYACGGDPAATIKFQAVFFENRSDILFNYADVVVGGTCPYSDKGGSATVGVQVASDLGTQYSFETPSLNDRSSLLWTLASSTLTVTKSGNGSGTVTAIPAGINCGADCSEAYSNGTVVTLSAVAASGSSFTGWSGAGCAGTGTCTVTMNSNQAVAANFVLAQADLVVSSLTVPTCAGAGQSVSVNDTTKNQGTGGAAASTTRFYLSTNTTFDTADTALGNRSVPALAAATTNAATTSVTLPTGLAPGTYYLLACADADNVVPETQESNNCTARSIAIGPDLVMSALTVPSAAGAGQGVTLSDTTKNQGCGGAGASETRFYFSTNPTVDAADTLLGSRAVPALAAAATNPGSTSVTLPAAITTATYYVIACADAASAVVETNENNNCTSRAIAVGPDLAIAALTAPSVASSGQAVVVSDTTRNQGGGAAGASATRLYLSVNTLVDTGDTLLGSRSVPALSAGATSAGTTTVTIPAGTATGNYYLLACADAGGAITETYESNNCTYRTTGIGPDLVMFALTVPSTAAAGQAIAVNDTTKNQGGATAGASQTRFYFSTNSTVDTSDTVLGNRSVPDLSAGATNAGTTTVTIPAGAATGLSYLLACADAGGAVGEIYENNNCTYRTIAIGPDLTVSSLAVPSTAAAGQTIAVSDTTKNQGGAAAGASQTRFYFSINTTVDTSDAVLGDRSVPGLSAGTTNAGTINVTVPASAATGNYYLFACADAGGGVVETSETNNCTYRVIAIGSDLVVSALTVVPTVTGPGQTITVSVTITNQGGGAAGGSTTRLYLSTNTTVDASDVILGNSTVPGLTTGGTSTTSTNVTVPAGTSIGTYYLFVCADTGGVVTETQESNNCTFRTVAVGPDLLVSTLTIPSTASRGQTIAVNDTTRNQGGATAGGSETRLYLSTNTTFDAADVVLASRAVPSLVAGASDAATTNLVIPSATVLGNYYILARSDVGGAVVETNENNNTTYRFISIN